MLGCTSKNLELEIGVGDKIIVNIILQCNCIKSKTKVEFSFHCLLTLLTIDQYIIYSEGFDNKIMH